MECDRFMLQVRRTNETCQILGTPETEPEPREVTIPPTHPNILNILWYYSYKSPSQFPVVRASSSVVRIARVREDVSA